MHLTDEAMFQDATGDLRLADATPRARTFGPRWYAARTVLAWMEMQRGPMR